MTPAKPDSLIDDLQSLSDELDDKTGKAPRRKPAAATSDAQSIDSLIEEIVALHLPLIERELRERLGQLGAEELRSLQKRSK